MFSQRISRNAGGVNHLAFRDLDKKDLSSEDRAVMEELVNKHVSARQIVRELLRAKEHYLAGDTGAVKVIVRKLGALSNLYSGHIEKDELGQIY